MPYIWDTCVNEGFKIHHASLHLLYVFVLNLLGVSFDRETVEEPTIRFGHQKTPRISQSGNQIQPSLTIPDAPWDRNIYLHFLLFMWPFFVGYNPITFGAQRESNGSRAAFDSS